MTCAWKTAHVKQQGGGICVCVRVFQTLKEKESGVALQRHNAPLYSGSVVGELLTSGCFLREAAKHRKSRLVCWVCGCVCGYVCLMENWGALWLCFVLIYIPATSDKSASVSVWMGNTVKQKAAWDAVRAGWKSNTTDFFSFHLCFSKLCAHLIHFLGKLDQFICMHDSYLTGWSNTLWSCWLRWSGTALIKEASLCFPRTH